jgi:hypothetical protein
VEGVGPEAEGGVNGVHDGFDGVEISGDLVFGDDKWRGDFENHEVVAARLREDFVVLEETHDVHAAEVQEAGPLGIDEVAAGGGGGLAGLALENGRSHELPQYVRRGEGDFRLNERQGIQKMKGLLEWGVGGEGSAVDWEVATLVLARWVLG